MQATQSSTSPGHKVQRLSRDNQDNHPRGLVRAWVIFCDAPECANYQIVDYIAPGTVGQFPQAVLVAALKNWELNTNASVCYCPTHKGYVHNPQRDYTSLSSGEQLQDADKIRRFQEANATEQ